MDRWINSLMMAWVLMFGLVLVTGAQDDCTLWMCEYVPAPTAPYEFCPTVDGYNVTTIWEDWKAGKNHAFDDYWRSYEYYELDGVWYMVAGAEDWQSALVYAGIYWDVPASMNGFLIPHPSCGVWIIDAALWSLWSLDS